jgi:hypothetical protein
VQIADRCAPWKISSGAHNLVWTKFEPESYVTTDGQSASLSWNKSPIWGLRPDFITVRQLRIYVGRCLWQDDGSVVYNCCWSSPAQSLSQIRDFPFVASYDSQGYGGGMRPRLHTGLPKLKRQSQSHIATDGQSVSQSILVSWPDVYYCLTVTVLLLWGALSDERTGLVCLLPESLSALLVICHNVKDIYILHVKHVNKCI